MSDNLERDYSKSAQESGFFVRTVSDGYLLSCHSSQLVHYTSRVLASQQAAHEEEIARLKEELREEQEAYECTNKTLNQVVADLSSANAACAMKDEVLRTFDGSFALDQLDETYPPSRGWDNKRINALSSSPQQVSEWERKQLEPLRAKVAMLHDSLLDFNVACDSSLCSGAELAAYHKSKSALSYTQATAEQFIAECEQRGAVKALEDFGEPFKFSYPWIYNECKKVAAQLRATSKKAG